MRPFLVTKFFCSVCGGELGIVYNKDTEARPRPSYNPEVDRTIKEPTGADMVYQTIMIAPCYRCQEPLRQFKKATELIKESMK